MSAYPAAYRRAAYFVFVSLILQRVRAAATFMENLLFSLGAGWFCVFLLRIWINVGCPVTK